MEIKFYKIDVSEKDMVLDLFIEAAKSIAKMNIDHWQYWMDPPEEKLKWVASGLRNGAFFVIKTGDDKTIGMVQILNEDELYWGKQTETALYVHSLVVKDTYKGLGLGQQILQDIEQQARRKDCRYLRLDADAKNPKLCRYYETIGFRKVGTKVLPLSVYNLYQKDVSSDH
ncbi:GNAT family N-acetyltransferase [Formosa haliotis]|uniref:GNAT family N-acetyltransferase n=1 Tax=Formosa haliotis TaxID=1555194 RepID=UPI0008254097|nr:GNAT family N-acetyltransferase [Formosa haliotis]